MTPTGSDLNELDYSDKADNAVPRSKNRATSSSDGFSGGMILGSIDTNSILAQGERRRRRRHYLNTYLGV